MKLDELKKVAKALVSIPSVFVGTMAADTVFAVLAENGIELAQSIQVLVYLVISVIVGFIVWRVPNKPPDVELSEDKPVQSWTRFEEENKKDTP